MITPDFRARLRRNDPLIGTLVTLRSPEVSELLALAGYDWLFLDSEHGPLQTSELLGMLQAVGDRATCLVRVPAAEEAQVTRVLDAGAGGIIFPQISTVSEAARATSICRYPPEGARGAGLGRAHGYGLRTSEYIRQANDSVVVVIQAETRLAVENISELAQVDGVDAVLVGPNDLAASYGKPGQLDDPEVVEAIKKIALACQQHGMPLGIFGSTPEFVQRWKAQGFSLLVCGVDVLLLGKAAVEQLQQLN